jgi:hypothetical protein
MLGAPAVPHVIPPSLPIGSGEADTGQRLGSIFRSPSRYGRSASGIVTEPSASW